MIPTNAAGGRPHGSRLRLALTMAITGMLLGAVAHVEANGGDPGLSFGKSECNTIFHFFALSNDN